MFYNNSLPNFYQYTDFNCSSSASWQKDLKQFYRFGIEIWLVIMFIKGSYFQWLDVSSVRKYNDCTFIKKKIW